MRVSNKPATPRPAGIFSEISETSRSDDRDIEHSDIVASSNAVFASVESIYSSSTSTSDSFLPHEKFPARVLECVNIGNKRILKSNAAGNANTNGLLAFSSA